MKNNGTIVIERNLLRSVAYKELKDRGIRVLLRFYGKRKMKKHKDSKGNERWTILNNGEIVFTYSEAEKMGINRKQFSKTIDDLLAKGFIEITHQGTGPGTPSTYKLCERWKAYGTKDFQPAAERRKNLTPGMGWDGYNKRKKQQSGVQKDTNSGVQEDTKHMK
jgi:hypothetical protein